MVALHSDDPNGQQLWTKDPSVLIKHPTEFLPDGGLSDPRNANAVARLIIVATIVGFLITSRVGVLLVGVSSLVALTIAQRQGTKENFTDAPNVQDDEELAVEMRAPTRSNPLMNVMLTDYKDDPERPPAAPAFNPGVEKVINEKASSSELYPEAMLATDGRSKLYQDLGDELMFDQSMRNFYAMPNTTIPNDKDAFAKYCYGTMPSCKDGDELQCWNNVNSLQTRTA
jgi:hypothetical protein